MHKQVSFEPSFPEIELAIEEIDSTYAYFYTPNFKFVGESHEAWELVYVNFGDVIIETEEYTKTLSKGQAFIHIPNEFHKIRANNVACNTYICSFICKCDRLYNIAQRVINLSPNLKQMLFTIIEEGQVYLGGKNGIPISKKTPLFASGQVVKNLLELLLIELIRDKENAQTVSEAKDSQSDITLAQQSLVEHIIEYLNQNLQSKVKLDDIAGYVGYSIPHICSVFKKTMNMSIINYFITLKINKAKQLMADGKQSLRQISEHLMFESIQYFSSQFKKVTGLMPSQYLAYLKTKNYKYDGEIKIL